MVLMSDTGDRRWAAILMVITVLMNDRGSGREHGHNDSINMAAKMPRISYEEKGGNV